MAVEHYRPIAKAGNNIQYVQKVVLTVSDTVFSFNRHTEPAITLADETVQLESKNVTSRGDSALEVHPWCASMPEWIYCLWICR